MSAIIDKIHRAYDLPKYVWLDDETGVEKYWVDENEILHIKFVAYSKVVELPVGGNEEILCEDDHGIPCVYDEEDGWVALCDSCVECGYFADECYCMECEEEENEDEEEEEEEEGLDLLKTKCGCEIIKNTPAHDDCICDKDGNNWICADCYDGEYDEEEEEECGICWCCDETKDLIKKIEYDILSGYETHWYCQKCYAERQEEPVPSVPRAIITGIDGVEYEIKIKRSRK
jgi:hypothetical protein